MKSRRRNRVEEEAKCAADHSGRSLSEERGGKLLARDGSEFALSLFASSLRGGFSDEHTAYGRTFKSYYTFSVL